LSRIENAVFGAAQSQRPLSGMPLRAESLHGSTLV
jgi:hypothetical protein